ncbi:hypothetical protein [Paenibacillus sp. MMS20-IR301]|uniref:hypothetical protein n=1 Tax=Paenibacillus sp. MMS20-IR301 TaxID=2895946 RepID=UPI0028E20FCB|nr:hypothetical protein [Paenibacillus sp. MMS20-IR301]WNS45625.1 hypothetical protein LOS79_10245 [Paenibacillus sp. MMS20-IR301]
MDKFPAGKKQTRYLAVMAAGLLILCLIAVELISSRAPAGAAKDAAMQLAEKVQPNVTFVYDSYRVTDSKSPGFPLIIAAEGADEISLSADSGGFVGWNPPDYTVRGLGTEVTVAPGDTIYWTPLTEASAPQFSSGCELTVSVYRSRSVISEARIMIRSDENGVYTGTWTAVN